MHAPEEIAARTPDKTLVLPVAPRANSRLATDTNAATAQTVLSPAQAASLADRALASDQPPSGVVLAGPGEPLATPALTLQAMALIKDRHPGLKVTLVTNGLGAAALAQEIAEAGPDAVLVEMHAADPETARRVYAWVRPGTRTLPPAQAMEILLRDQAKAMAAFKALGLETGVRTKVVPGANSGQIEAVAAKAAELGASRMVLVPADPGPDSRVPPMDDREMEALRGLCLGHVARVEIESPEGPGKVPNPDEVQREAYPQPAGDRPRVAVASTDGFEVNLHLGQAQSLLIYGPREDGLVSLMGTRSAPPRGGGDARWNALADTLKDCSYLLASGAGENPTKVLGKAGLKVLVTDGDIEGTVDVLYGGGKKGRQGKRPQTC